MFELKLSYGNTRKSVAAEATDTISKAIRDNEISTQVATIAITGRILDAGSYDKTFADFGVEEGSSAMLSVVVKTAAA